MSYDFLKPVLGDELFAQIDEKLKGASGITLANVADGSYIPKNKFDEVNSKLKTANTSVTTLTAQLDAEKQKSGDADALNQRIEQLTSDVAARDAEIARIGMSYRIKDALRGLNVRNADVVMPLLKLDKITEQDGSLVGLDEQVEEIKKTDGYLFADTHPSRLGFGGALGGNGGGKSEPSSADANAAIRMAAGRQ